MSCIIPGHEPGADLGPLISPAAKQRVLDLIQSGVTEGADLVLDGRGVTVPGYENGNFVGPTIIHKVQVIGLSGFTVGSWRTGLYSGGVFCLLLKAFSQIHLE